LIGTGCGGGSLKTRRDPRDSLSSSDANLKLSQNPAGLLPPFLPSLPVEIGKNADRRSIRGPGHGFVRLLRLAPLVRTLGSVPMPKTSAPRVTGVRA
jgi:hypothetical protein